MGVFLIFVIGRVRMWVSGIGVLCLFLIVFVIGMVWFSIMWVCVVVLVVMLSCRVVGIWFCILVLR